MTTASAPRRFFAILLCACVLALPACDSDDSDDGEIETSAAVEGSWESSFEADRGTAEIEMTITSEDGLIDGIGTGTESGMTYNFDISGSYTDPDVTINFNPESAGGLSLSFDGEVVGGGDTMRGTISNQQGINVEGVVFDRQ